MLISSAELKNISSVSDLFLKDQESFFNSKGELAIPTITVDSTSPVVKTTKHYADTSVDCFVEEGMLCLFYGFDVKHDSVYLVLDFSSFKEFNRNLLTKSFYGKDDELLTAEEAGYFYDTDFFYFCETIEFDVLVQNPDELNKKLLKALTPQTTRIFYSENKQTIASDVIADNKPQLFEFLDSYLSASNNNTYADTSKVLVVHPLKSDSSLYRLVERNLEFESMTNLGFATIDYIELMYAVGESADDYDSENVLTVSVNISYFRSHKILDKFRVDPLSKLSNQNIYKDVVFFGFGLENKDFLKNFQASEIYDKIADKLNSNLTSIF